MDWRLKYFIRYMCPVFFKGYLYLKNLFSKSNRQERERVIKAYADKTDDGEIAEVLNYIRKHKTLDMYNYDFCEKYLYHRDAEIEYDAQKKMYYVWHLCDDGIKRKLYFADTISNPYLVRGIYNCLLMESDIRSPHRYINEFCSVPVGGNMADVGAQEGLLGLNNIDSINRLYLFECDKSWIRALEATFEPWKDKVCIVSKFVGDTDDEEFVKLDTYFEDKDIDLIKMDIEGWEISALHGGKNILKRSGVIWAVCSYHKPEDERQIIEIYRKNGLEYKVSSGLVYIRDGENVNNLRHALIWGKHV